MASPTSVHRTGPHREAFDYSKTLVKALVEEDNLPIGAVSRVQLLLTCLVERLHDAIYVLPRHARTNDAMEGNHIAPDPEEYAKDVAATLKALKKYAQQLPDDLLPVIDQAEADSINKKLLELRNENRNMLNQAKSVQDKLYLRLIQ